MLPRDYSNPFKSILHVTPHINVTLYNVFIQYSHPALATDVVFIIYVLDRVVVKRRSVDKKQQRGQQEGDLVVIDPIRYTTGGRKSVPAKPKELEGEDLSYEKKDYEDMDPSDQPIYEETF